MKAQEQLADIERHGVVDRITCGMEPTAHSFKMLARQYSDPIKAILQELGANASDSHIRAGKSDDPFRVSLPTRLDPHIRVRDFGVSMSPDVIKNVYANYMKSDKQHTNDEVGYFGIGSKTPLAYGDSFNITTYLDGKLRMYTMCYNESGIPELNVYGEHETEEPNGVEVSFAVKEDDYNRFLDKAEHVYSFFQTAPIVNGSDRFALKTYERVLEGDDWYFTGQYNQSYVVMGNIAYPVNPDQMPRDSKARDILKNGVHFTVPMGAVHMTPSREALEYNESTRKAIMDRCEEIAAEVEVLVVVELDKCENKWQASLLAKKWGTKIHSFNWDLSASKWDLLKNVEIEGANWKCKYFRKGSKITRSIKVGYNKAVSSQTKIVIQDQDRGFDKASRYFVDSNDDIVVYLMTDKTKKEVLDVIGALESDEVVFLSSELPTPPKAARGAYTRKTTRTVKGFCPKGDSPTRSNVYDSRFWNTECEIDPTEDQVYIYMERYDLDFDVRNALTRCKSLGLDVPEIIGLNNATSKLANKPNFTHFRDWIKAELAELDGDYIQERAANMHALCQMSLGKQLKIVLENGGEVTDEDSPAKLLVEYTQSLSDTKTDNFVDAFVVLAQQAGYNFEYDKDSAGFEELEQAVRERYPIVIELLDEISSWDVSGHSETMVNTINLIDTAINCGGSK